MIGIFLDTETNGLNPNKHSVLELAYKMIDTATGEPVHSYQTYVAQSREVWDQGDKRSLGINGITWEEISSGSPPQEVAKKIEEDFAHFGVERGKAIFICQNPSFDRAFFSQLIDPDKQEALNWPYHWLDLASMYWTVHPAPWTTGVSKDKISEYLSLPPETKPHKAMNGVDHLLLCYQAIVGFPESAVKR